MRNSRTGVPSVAGARGAEAHGVDLAHIAAWRGVGGAARRPAANVRSALTAVAGRRSPSSR
jgi:hypothetical protein